MVEVQVLGVVGNHGNIKTITIIGNILYHVLTCLRHCGWYMLIILYNITNTSANTLSASNIDSMI